MEHFSVDRLQECTHTGRFIIVKSFTNWFDWSSWHNNDQYECHLSNGKGIYINWWWLGAIHSDNVRQSYRVTYYVHVQCVN